MMGEKQPVEYIFYLKGRSGFGPITLMTITALGPKEATEKWQILNDDMNRFGNNLLVLIDVKKRSNDTKS